MSPADLRQALAAQARGRGAASVAVVDRPGAEPRAVWVPESADEPAFLAYSITKTFTASLVLMLCEEGRLGVDDPLARWFPGIVQSPRISVRQLLSHTGGIPDYGGLPAYHDGVRSAPSTPWSFERFAAETYERGLLFEPGRGWAYSNPGYMLLKGIVEEVSGARFRDVVSERIVGPLGLRRTFVPESVDDLASLAPGTSTQLATDGSRRDARMHYHPGWVSHGVVASTASDIARFLDALFQGRLLSPHSREQMLASVAVPMASSAEPTPGDAPLRPGRPGYGLGLMVDPASPWGLLAGHNGGGPCYSASAFHALESGVSVCAMGAIEDDFSAERVVADVLDRCIDVGEVRFAV